MSIRHSDHPSAEEWSNQERLQTFWRPWQSNNFVPNSNPYYLNFVGLLKKTAEDIELLSVYILLCVLLKRICWIFSTLWLELCCEKIFRIFRVYDVLWENIFLLYSLNARTKQHQWLRNKIWYFCSLLNIAR
jgi:hypothetical protein